MKSECDVILLDRAALPGVAHVGLFGFGGPASRVDRSIVGRDVAIKLHDLGDGFFDVELAGNRQE